MMNEQKNPKLRTSVIMPTVVNAEVYQIYDAREKTMGSIRPTEIIQLRTFPNMIAVLIFEIGREYVTPEFKKSAKAKEKENKLPISNKNGRIIFIAPKLVSQNKGNCREFSGFLDYPRNISAVVVLKAKLMFFVSDSLCQIFQQQVMSAFPSPSHKSLFQFCPRANSISIRWDKPLKIKLKLKWSVTLGVLRRSGDCFLGLNSTVIGKWTGVFSVLGNGNPPNEYVALVSALQYLKYSFGDILSLSSYVTSFGMASAITKPINTSRYIIKQICAARIKQKQFKTQKMCQTVIPRQILFNLILNFFSSNLIQTSEIYKTAHKSSPSTSTLIGWEGEMERRG